MTQPEIIAGILPPSAERIGWIALQAPLTEPVSISLEGSDSPLVIQPGPTRSRADLLAMLLPGENLLPNAGFDDQFAHWAPNAQCGLDFKPPFRLSDGHVAFIRLQPGRRPPSPMTSQTHC